MSVDVSGESRLSPAASGLDVATRVIVPEPVGFAAEARSVVLDGRVLTSAVYGGSAHVVANSEDAPMQWIPSEIFAHVPWLEDMIEFLGPRTVALLPEAQGARGPGAVGRWPYADGGAY